MYNGHIKAMHSIGIFNQILAHCAVQRSWKVGIPLDGFHQKVGNEFNLTPPLFVRFVFLVSNKK